MKTKRRIIISLLCIGFLAALGARGLAEETAALYVGAAACEGCHAEQYQSYLKNSNKPYSWRSIAKMQSKLTESEKKECYACHTTGYGKPGGFVSITETPEKANVSCESCHGPGSKHVESMEAQDIRRKPDLAECVTCHNGDRIRNFNFKPMLYHGGH